AGLQTRLPDRVGPYRPLRVLGVGGMGVVYLAEDTRLGRTVALKALAPWLVDNAAQRERLRREARAAASLNHPGIATIYALEEIDDNVYIASEYVPGETLRDEIARGPLEPLRAIDTMIGIARALAAAHQRGIVHRDLKPENVMRTPDGDVKILDFGLAQSSDLPSAPSVPSRGVMTFGTPLYMSPEQIRGDAVDQRSDVFSLGVVLYELVTGATPFASADPKSTIADDAPGHVSRISLRHVERVVLVCLRVSPEARFASAADLLRALEEARSHLTSADHDRKAAPVPAGPAPREGHAIWWWQFHQAAATLVYLLLLIPLWRVRDLAPWSSGTLLFVVGLVGVVIASALRWHLWFAVRLDPAAWHDQHGRSRRWILAGDALFVVILVSVGVFSLLAERHWGILLLAAAAAVLVSFAVIEPATARAAFGQTYPSTPSRSAPSIREPRLESEDRR
ncbi:MAG TPA: serine/threonine-protein kinase, partial [Vicinamibacterales bacterium]|nr:serine/threonine-protein kinase [Vicinamibacterales bacterium]